MLKSCPKCGRIHDFNYECRKRHYNKGQSIADKFRNKNSWKKKRDLIKDRDKHLCRCCLADFVNAPKQFNFSNLEVHHIIPLEEDVSLGLDDDNLITLCSYHHKLAENGVISRKILRELTNENADLLKIKEEYEKK